jgi:hypothetical protein
MHLAQSSHRVQRNPDFPWAKSLQIIIHAKLSAIVAGMLIK